jgi:monoamine oxidase
MRDIDVVVVGAGLAGLSAARKLVAAGLSVVVLEARDRVAGRNKGGFLSNGVAVELGGQWVGPTQDAILELIKELGLETYPTHAEGVHVTMMDGEKLRYTNDDGSVFGLSDLHTEEILRLWAELETLAAAVDLDCPWRSDGAAELDRQTLDGWLVIRTDSQVVRRFYRFLIPALFSAESPELSLLHFLFYVRSGTSLKTLVSFTGGAQESRVIGGTHRISEKMAAELGDRVRLNSIVHTIRQNETGVIVEYDGGRVAAARVVVAVPTTLAGRLRYVPALPALRDSLTQQMPAGSVIKYQIGYDTPFWREQGLSGSAVSLDDEFNVVMDNSPIDASCGVLVGFLEGTHARAACQLTKEARRELVLRCVTRYFGPQAAEPFDLIEQDWNAEEFSRGCYGGRLGAGAWTEFGAALAAPVGRIHWAGAETASVWNGYMDGAVRSGYRAAGEILHHEGHLTDEELS